ncbi:MAG: transporter substrate-binding domain-containing protein, partial [Anaerolineae bacterium]|nr:transporter substrate-binding domain-containing protein [Anaerolineae bacterium]
MNGKSNRSLFLIVSLLLTAVFLLAACGNSDPTPTTAPTAAVPPTNTAEPTANPDGGNIEAINDPTWARIQQTGTMLVGMSLDYPPFESYTEDFEATGYDVALIQEIGKRLDLEVEIKDIAFDGLGNAIFLGAIDTAVSAISVSPERDALVDFSNVYYISEDAVLSQVDSGIDEIPTIEDVAEYRVGVQRGSIFEDWIRTELIEPGYMPEENLLVYLEAGDIIRDLREGRIELAVMDLYPAQLAVEEYGDIQIIGNGLNRQRYAIAMAQGSPLLQRAINDTLVAMQNEGVLADLAKEYLNLDPDEIIPIPTPDPSVPTATPGAPPTGCIDHMAFVQDLNYDDQNMTNPPKFLPGQAFRKGWRIQNTGTCTWDSNYSFVYVRGNNSLARMGGQPTPIRGTVTPGQMYDMYVDLVAPAVPGIYQGFWSMRNPSGVLFGESVWVGIEVVGTATLTPAPTQTPVPGIVFTVNQTQIQAGECVTFSWRTENIQAVFFYPQGADWTRYGVPGVGTSTQCPSHTTTYELRVQQRDGSFVIQQITITVTPVPGAPSIDRFTVEPVQILPGQCVNLQWQVSGNVSRVIVSRDGTAIWNGAPVSGQMQDCPPGTGRRSYQLEAQGPGGTSRKTQDVTVVSPTAQPTNIPTMVPPTATATPVVIPTATPAPPVINSFTVSPNQIEVNQCVTVNWSTGGGTSYVRLLRNGNVILDDAAHSGALPDCLSAAGTYTYRLEASGNGQTKSAEQKVTVNAAPQPTATPNPLINIQWRLTNLNGTPPTSTITTVFDNSGHVSGNDGCNS